MAQVATIEKPKDARPHPATLSVMVKEAEAGPATFRSG
jgi:hypothetical protein